MSLPAAMSTVFFRTSLPPHPPAGGVPGRPGGPIDERAREIGVGGDSNENVVKGVDLVVLATKSNAAIETGASLADAIGDTPVLCVASDLRFTEIGIVPGLEEGS